MGTSSRTRMVSAFFNNSVRVTKSGWPLASRISASYGKLVQPVRLLPLLLMKRSRKVFGSCFFQQFGARDQVRLAIGFAHQCIVWEVGPAGAVVAVVAGPTSH